MAIKKNKCIILGSGQFCNFIIQVINDIKEIDCLGYISENGKKNNKIKLLNCLGDDNYLKINIKEYDSVFPAIGELKIREKLIYKVLKNHKEITSVIHPTSIQSKTAKFKKSSLMANSFLSNEVIIGNYSVIGTGSYIHHDTVIGKNCLIGGGTQIGASVKIGDNVILDPAVVMDVNAHVGSHCYLSSGVVLSGGCEVEKNVMMEAGVIVSSCRKVGKNQKVAAGSVISESLEGLYRKGSE